MEHLTPRPYNPLTTMPADSTEIARVFVAPGHNTDSARVPPVTQLTGEVVYIYAFDVAYEMLRTPIPTLMGQTPAHFSVDASKRNPRQVFFYKAQMIRLPPLERFGPLGPVRIERSVKVLPVGAISITVRVPFKVDRVSDLVVFHDLRFTNGVHLYEEVRELAEQVRKELAPYCIRPNPTIGEEEAYTAFCIHSPMRGADGQTLKSADWMEIHRRDIASLLTEEPDPDQLSAQETEESTARFFSYYNRDLTVIDWDAALVIDEPRYFDETLYIMELANLQLAELEAYDRLLDSAVERVYRDLGGRRLGRWTGKSTLHDLREIRMDLARLHDELSNITKFFGDWHLARIYQGLSSRFHLADWQKAVDEKLKTMGDIYQILQHDRNNAWMMVLEIMIVALFVIDIIFIFAKGK